MTYSLLIKWITWILSYMILSGRKTGNSQSTEKISIIVNFFFADFRTSFSYLNKIFWLKNTKIFTWPHSLDHLSITKFLKAETLYMVQITKYILDMIYAVFRTFIWQIWQVLLLCFVSFHSWAAPLF